MADTQYLLAYIDEIETAADRFPAEAKLLAGVADSGFDPAAIALREVMRGWDTADAHYQAGWAHARDGILALLRDAQRQHKPLPRVIQAIRKVY